MDNFDVHIRNTVRAVIVRDKQILLLHKNDTFQGERFALPGGAQDLGETLEQAINRECREEIDADIEIGDLLHIADFFKQRTKPEPHVRHQIEFLFACSIPDSYILRNGPHPDKSQVGVVWVDLSSRTARKMVCRDPGRCRRNQNRLQTGHRYDRGKPGSGKRPIAFPRAEPL